MQSRDSWLAQFSGAAFRVKRCVTGSSLACAIGVGVLLTSTAQASAETRTLSMYFTHTKESITVTYMRNGRYDPAALKKVNWFLRDWRRNEPTNMSLETLDLLWELHADLGSKKPVHIVSAYRSPKTNAMLKRIGRKVAKTSQHMRGKAIDFYFPDVPTEKIMGSALVRKVGGVGYYPRSGQYGFVHIDSGNVRHWPRMSPSRFASISSKYARTVNARRGGIGNTLLAAAQTGNRYSPIPDNQVASNVADDEAEESGPANLVPASMADAVLAAMSKTTPPSQADEQPLALATAARFVMPKPRPKPIEVLMLAAANMQITPASAPVETNQNFNVAGSPVRGNLAPTTIASLAYEDRSTLLASNTSSKGSLTGTDVRAANPADAELRPLSVNYASASSMTELFPTRDGAPQPFINDQSAQIPVLDQQEKSALGRFIAMLTGGDEGATAEGSSAVNRSAKGDSQVVNRNGKGNFQAAPATWQQTSARETEVLKVVEAPLTFSNQ